MSRFLAIVAALTLPAALLPAMADADHTPPPTDYKALAPQLSQPTFTDIERTAYRIKASHDGVELYVEVVRPKAPGRYPVILEASPYHGTLADRNGSRILPHPTVDGKPVGLTGWFPPRGYAVVMFDLRGTGRSRGCLDQLGPNDAKDLKQVVEWAAAQDWSNGRVGMTGHSYVGSTPMVAAAQDPKGLVTIVPSAGLASMYDHQFQGGVPFWLQWAGPQWSYQMLAIDRKTPSAIPQSPLGGTRGDDVGANGLPNNPQDTGCGLPSSALVSGEDQLSGRYAPWHAARDWRAGATGANIPMFLVHGVNDNAARITAADWFIERDNRPGDKAWIGQWDHGVGVAPTRRELQWTYALTAWFDKQLKQRDVPTGPAAELFMSDSTFTDARGGARKWVVTSDEGWPGTTETVRFFATADKKLSPAAGAAGTNTFSGDARGFTVSNGTGGLIFESAPLTKRMVFAGLPRMRLSGAVTVPRVHLIATIQDVYPGGDRRRISQCSINPELREGIAKLTPVLPALRMDLEPPCMAMAHNLEAGHKLAVRITTADPDKAPLFATDPQVTVFSGPDATSIDLPVVPDAEVQTDLPKKSFGTKE